MTSSQQTGAQILQRLDQMHQSAQTPIEDHERRFNRTAQPIIQAPQYQAYLIQIYIKTLHSKDLRRALRNRSRLEEDGGQPPQPQLTLGHIQKECRYLNRKFNSIDAFKELYTLKQDYNTPIANHNYEIEKRLALLEVPMEDDLLQDLYRKSLRPDVRDRLARYTFPTYVELRNAAIQISP